MVAVLRAVESENSFGKQKQIDIEMTARVISNQNRYWCRRSVACKRNSDDGECNCSDVKSKNNQWRADKKNILKLSGR
jgi:hypothetical protein